MDQAEAVARCFADAFIEWSRDETAKILAMDPFDQVFANMHKEIQDKAVMDILTRAAEKVKALNV